MEKLLESFDVAKIAAGLCPAAMIAIWRSYCLKGAFPTIGKDDIGGLLLIAAVYFLFLQVFGIRINEDHFIEHHNPWLLIFMLLVLPSIIGIVLGFIEIRDWWGRFLRRMSLRVPSPHPTAWQTIFRELATWDMLIIHVKDGEPICGRWAPDSSASLDDQLIDLYLSEYGVLNATGIYEPHTPQRGVYIRVEDVKAIEIVRVESEEAHDRETFTALLRRKYRKAIGA